MTTRKFTLALGAALALATCHANAWFIFIPGALTSKIGDALTGAEGENCVGVNAKVGDVLRNPSGSTATIKSVSGTSTRCRDPKLPIRALMEFQFTKSQIGLSVPDGYEQRSLTDMQRFQGFILKAENPAKHTAFMVSSLKRDGAPAPATVAHNISENMKQLVDNASTTNAEELTINGMPAWRFELTGKSRGLFGATHTYLVTILAGTKEIVTINAWAPVDNYLREKEEFAQISASVKGLLDVAGPANSAALVPQAQPAPTLPPDSAPAPVVLSPAPIVTSTPPMLQPVPAASTATGQDQSNTDLTIKKLRELDKLYKDGILNQSEYEGKKKELLKAL